jgi:hypothetical protein
MLQSAVEDIQFHVFLLQRLAEVGNCCLHRTNNTMSRWFRSEPMEYISLIVNEDAAHDCLSDLGKLGVIQFTDVRPFPFCGDF